MTKNEFFRTLKGRISHLPKNERRKILQYYTEMISERMEDGMTEAEAIDAIGNMDDLLADYPAEPKTRHRAPRLRTWHIVMLIAGAPLWIPLAATVFSFLIAFYAVIWSMVVAFYAVFVALFVSGLTTLVAGFASIATGEPQCFLTLAGAGFLLMGFAILWFVPCTLFARAMAKTTKNVSKGIFRFFFKRG